MPFYMCNIALALACFAGVADGRRAHGAPARARTSPEEAIGVASSDAQSFAEVGADASIKPSVGLAMLLLAIEPASASWSAGARHALGVSGGRSYLLRQGQQGRVVEGGPTMINLFGNNEESQKRRNDLSLRDAPVGSNKVQFRKPNQATQGLQLGLKFREGFNKAVYIDKILPNTEADRLKRAGKINEGDEVTMVSATFGDEMWSARGVGKYRLEKSISVRQGMTISFCFETSDKDSKRRAAELKTQKDKEAAMMTRLQKQLTQEVEDEKKKKGGGWFGR